jgi:hypothetical protein
VVNDAPVRDLQKIGSDKIDRLTFALRLTKRAGDAMLVN